MLPTPTASNPLQELQHYGQSVWLDYIRRSSIVSGELQDMVTAGEIWGVTSNPAIFEKAIAGSTDYDDALRSLEADRDRDAISLYEQLAIFDIQATADILRPIYDRTNYRDGYVSLEVSPYLANDTEQTLQEAHRLWLAVDRPNLMIKVPANPAGIPAIQQLISEGINVNVTLLFNCTAYELVAEAYISGLETYADNGGDLSRVASVASFFVSRIDTAVDNLIMDRLKISTNPQQQDLLKSLLGKVAISNAKVAYQSYLALYLSERWLRLAAHGAQPQRLLWASTGTKNPHQSEVLYVEELIGVDTVNTIPPATLAAFRDRGKPAATLTQDVNAAREVLLNLHQVGISLSLVTDRLLVEGMQLFENAFDRLLIAVEQNREAVLGDAIDRLTYKLPNEAMTVAVAAAIQDWQTTGKIRRLWAQDASLWTGADENLWLGWLGITEDQLAHLDRLKQLAQEVRELQYTHVLLLGMGGSSLCPEVLKLTFGNVTGFPELLVLDSTDPAQIHTIERQIDITKTLFIVSSKSGSTLEPNIFKQYFFDRLQKLVGAAAAGNRFIAITDPGSKLQQVAENSHFRHIFYGLPSIGGRYSALSNFGMVPAAVMGLDVERFLDRAAEMVHSCAPSVPASANPGVVLGCILGTLVNWGIDKVTLITSPGIADLGAWLEQLLAESTGKEGKGLIPIDREPLDLPYAYRSDRLFVYLRSPSAPDERQEMKIDILERDYPVVRIDISDAYQLGQEFFRWEIATAVAGSILGIHPFDQPDVEASKLVTRELTAAYETTGTLPDETPLLVEAGMQLFTDAHNAAVLDEIVGTDRSIAGYLRAHLNRLQAGDYFALLAYIEMNQANEDRLQEVRVTVRNYKRVATCLGFGPRFLHSTGQAYKGGSNSGVFLQITCDDAIDLPVPGQNYTFGIVKAAQARGDFQVLAERERRALRVHLGTDVAAGLTALQKIVRELVK
ncbi:bifunctional transaldolase/phosoglucose isomerase [Chamaesiphon polymorphus]|uniref:Transaldolase n=1 Tax=Chamaesiphon polymorphus CCALA 037 TaxID=2107692 RepID=A0A2T1GKX7_9CYAN|nr:bifunctional transaldolase/phosoglucose isomerase [Chamaesiphon polymorphus]PSB58436.1 transaldolase [Chamaesiphon polymorphus CCALA 037]